MRFGGLFFLALGIVTLYVAWGAWNLQSWAWMWLAVVIAIGLVLAVLNRQWFSAIVDAIVVYYLFRPEVKAAVGRSEGGRVSDPSRRAPAPPGPGWFLGGSQRGTNLLQARTRMKV